jgi:hypothetical protein
MSKKFTLGYDPRATIDFAVHVQLLKRQNAGAFSPPAFFCARTTSPIRLLA